MREGGIPDGEIEGADDPTRLPDEIEADRAAAESEKAPWTGEGLEPSEPETKHTKKTKLAKKAKKPKRGKAAESSKSSNESEEE